MHTYAHIDTQAKIHWHTHTHTHMHLDTKVTHAFPHLSLASTAAPPVGAGAEAGSAALGTVAATAAAGGGEGPDAGLASAMGAA